jgi:hypothetical protein
MGGKSGVDYLIVSADETAGPYAEVFRSMLVSVALGQDQLVSGVVANRPLRDYEAAPVAIILDAAQTAIVNNDADGIKEVLQVGMSLLAKWADYLNLALDEGHPHFNMEAK